ncbi:hypothetical protein AYI68_g799 [Smittium mucronatum]|uniref:Uncharacterized protein n=1 Tax=Smittium mucronatum TaxID=133383 RepID=A0A1R0H7A5_9FUNG|nr:hypothetical protein AYI68_g799 [Smittium mucronatum]
MYLKLYELLVFKAGITGMLPTEGLKPELKDSTSLNDKNPPNTSSRTNSTYGLKSSHRLEASVETHTEVWLYTSTADFLQKKMSRTNT